MRICIYGCGVVGEAYANAYESVGHDVFRHDIKYNTDISDIILFEPDIVYVCLPTPSNKDGSCNTHIIDYEFQKFYQRYGGFNIPVVIKSTVPPGTSDSLVDKYNINTELFGHSPEFLKERSAEFDAKNQKLLVCGTYGDTLTTRRIIESNEGLVKGATHRLVPSESELCKYYHNFINTAKIIIANEFYEICEHYQISYEKIKEVLLLSTSMPDEYLDVSEDLRGASGPCLNKDTKALKSLVESLGLDLDLIKTVPVANAKYEPTVFPGMRP